ncbi:hypothetical protein FOA52_015487 [Chlamydomonas sp. UWO 241]|nr:hypothetical protein FOA52_015487 [Chlamydomonas sp. UWO 241]
MVSAAVVEAVSGSVSSVISLLATYPLKTIYTLQALDSGQDSGKAAASVLEIISKYKLGGLYVGIEPNIFESGLSSGVYFYLYSRLRGLAVSQQRAARARAQGPGKPGDAGGSGTKHEAIGVLASLLVAALAGAGNQLVTMPASVVTTRMQARSKAKMDGRASGGGAGVASVMSEIYEESGLGGFWAGLLPALVLVANPAVQYMLYEQLLSLLARWKGERAARARAEARQRRQEAAAAAKGEEPPQEQEQQEWKRGRNGGSSSSGSGIGGSGSSSGSGKGGGALEVAAAPASQPSGDCGDTANGDDDGPCPEVVLSSLEIFGASALAKIGATVVTYPMIVVKSRMQATGKGGDVVYNGTLDAITRTFMDEGVGGFFKGLRAKILQTALNAALMLMLKEQLLKATETTLNALSSGATSSSKSSGVAGEGSSAAVRPPHQLIK